MINKHVISTLSLAALLSASAASASTPTWPTSVVGTWSGTSNLTSVNLTISTQKPAGHCQTIGGSMQDAAGGLVDPVSGYYCPSSGAMVFMRSLPGSQSPFQVYSLSLSQVITGNGLLLSGHLRDYVTNGGLGNYPVSLGR